MSLHKNPCAQLLAAVLVRVEGLECELDGRIPEQLDAEEEAKEKRPATNAPDLKAQTKS